MAKRFRFYFVLYSVVFAIVSCRNRQAILCSTDEEFCLAINDNQNTRTIFFDANDRDEFIKLDISKVDLETDGVFICWQGNSGKLEIANPNTTILEQGYDTIHYEFDNKIRVDSKGMPDVKYFHKKGCFEYNILSNAVFPSGHASKK